MELRHLRYFVAVAEEGHITRAAARLGIQQPPLSQQIRALEEELGVTLFERTARSVKLNEAGVSFLKDAKALLAATDDAVERLRRTAKGEQGRLVVGCTSSALLHDLPPRLLEAFRSRYPLVQVTMVVDTTRDLFDALSEQQVDVAFLRSPASRYPTLHSICLDEEAMVVALPRSHRLAATPDKPISLTELATEDFVSYRRADGPGIHDAVTAACHRAGSNAFVVEEVPRLITAVTTVATGRGVAIVPKALQTVQSNRVVYRPLDAQSAFTVPLTLAYRPLSAPGPVGHFLSLAKTLVSFSSC